MTLVLSIVLVEGTASIYGPVAAALALTFVSEGLANVEGLAEGRFILIAVAMVAVLVFLRKGLVSALPRSWTEKAIE